MKFGFDYSEEKNSILIETRGVGFDQIIEVIQSENLIDDQNNPNFKRYPGQKMFIVKVKKYVYVVPYVIDEKRQVYFLKTFYPSRKLNKRYLKNR